MKKDSLFNRVFRRARDEPAGPGTRNAVSDADTFYFGGTPSGEFVTPKSSLQLSTVYACVRVISESIAMLPLNLMVRTELGTEKSDSRLNYLVSSEPNAEMTSFIWRETMLTHMLLWGNSYSLIIRDQRGAIESLYPLLPDDGHMVVDRDEYGKLYYQYSTSNKTEILRPYEVLHIPALGFDGIMGYSPIALQRNAMGLYQAAEKYGSSFFRNSAMPGGVLEHPGVVKDLARLREMWQSSYGGENRGKTAILEEGMKFQAITVPNTDAQFLETRKFQVNEICRIFRVPPHMVCDLEHATFSNIEHQSIDFAVHTITPWVVRIEQALNRALISEREKGKQFFKFRINALTRGSYKERMDGYAVARQNGWMSANDIRDLEDMNRVPDSEGGNAYLVNGNMIPITTAMQNAAGESAANAAQATTQQEEGDTD